MKNTSEIISNIIENLTINEKNNLSKLLKEKNILFNPYNNPTAVSVAVIPVSTKNGIALLSIIRNIEPKIGEIALPGGFVDPHETFEMAAQRETKEETGLVLNVDLFTLSHSRVTKTNNVIVFCNYNDTIQEKDINLSFSNEEVQKIVLGTPNTQYCFPTHQETSCFFWKK